MFQTLIYFLVLRRNHYVWISIFTAAILGLANNAKYKNLRTPLSFNDFGLFIENIDSLTAFIPKTAFALAIFGLIIFPFIFRKFFNQKYLLGKIEITFVVLLSTLGSASIWQIRTQGEIHALGLKVYLHHNNPSKHLSHNGLIIYMAQGLNKTYTVIYPSKKEITSFLKNLTNQLTSQDVASCKSDVHDIVVVMTESFFDPTEIPNIRFSQDPTRSLKNMLSTSRVESKVFVPVFGGYTANSEFEFLTSASSYILPAGSVPYSDQVSKETPSIARHFRDNGYKTTAFHNYSGVFWNRRNVYPLLGFERFIDLEQIKDDMEYVRSPWGTDSVFVDHLPQILSGDQKNFLFSITLGTHGVYSGELNLEHSIDLTSEDFSKEELAPLSFYAQLLNQSSNYLSETFKTLLERDKPTVILYFGDHLPPVEQTIYKRTGYDQIVNNKFPNAGDPLKVIPAVILSNVENCEITLPPSISLTCLAPHLYSQFNTWENASPLLGYLKSHCDKNPTFSFEGSSESENSFKDFLSFSYLTIFSPDALEAKANPSD